MRIQLLDQQVKLCIKGRDGGRFAAFFCQGQRKAPNLFAFVLGQTVEKFAKSGNQVGFCEQDIDREMHPQLFTQFVQAPPHGLRMGLLRRLVLHRQIGQADRDDRTVDRLPFAVLFQQAKEAEPSGVIGLGVAVLRGVATSGVDQHGVIGEPPIAISGTANAANRGNFTFVG